MNEYEINKCAIWETYRINNINEFIEFIVKLNHKEKLDNFSHKKNSFEIPMTKNFNNYRQEAYKDDAIKEHYYYRGVSDNSYPLLPSVFRHSKKNAEYQLYHEILARCYDEFKGLNSVEKLVNMQHYNCHTRLLDITINPMVALYFACKSYSRKLKKKRIGAVYIFAFSEDEIHYSDSTRVQMLAHLARLDDKEKKNILEISLKRLNENKKNYSTNTKEGPYENPYIEKLYLDICNEIVAFKRDIIPFDILYPLLFLPSKSNDRIKKQDGAFIISGLSESKAIAEAKLRMLTKYELIIHNVDMILEELNYLGINESTLFPEIDNVANYLVNSIV